MIALASDHVGWPLKNVIIQYLNEKGLEYKDYGSYDPAQSVHYPEYGFLAAQAVAGHECEKGILFCGTGIGISLAANKVRGIRCACCSEPYSAVMSRRHNDANMLALGARVVGGELAKMIVGAWLDGEFEGGKHALRVEMIGRIEDGTFTL